jgi:hypothetical protein
MGKKNVDTVNSNNQNGIADFGQQHGLPDIVNVNPPQDNDDNDDYMSSFITFTPRLPPGSNNSYSLPSPIPEFGKGGKPIITIPDNNEETDSAYSINDIRYVDLAINDNNSLNILDNLNDYEYFRGSITIDNHLYNFYRKDSFDLNQEIKFLHSITCDIDYEPLDDIRSFKDTKFEIINDISDKLENQFLSAASKTNLLEFFDNSTKNNFKLKSDIISNLQSGLVKLDRFINENNYPNNILSLFEEGNNTSEFIGKILNESLTTEYIYEEKLNYKSNLTVPQTSSHSLNIDFTQENIISHIQRNIGSIIQEDVYPFINAQDRLNSNSFIIQLISNIGFSMYGIYPTILLQHNDIDSDNFIYQDLKSSYPSIIVNFFKEYGNIYNFNIFSNINVNSKSFDASKYIKNDLFLYNEKSYDTSSISPVSNSTFVRENNRSESQERELEGYLVFLSFIFGTTQISDRISQDNFINFSRDTSDLESTMINLNPIELTLVKLFHRVPYGLSREDIIWYIERSANKSEGYSDARSTHARTHSTSSHNNDDRIIMNESEGFLDIFDICDFLLRNKDELEDIRSFYIFDRVGPLLMGNRYFNIHEYIHNRYFGNQILGNGYQALFLTKPQIEQNSEVENIPLPYSVFDDYFYRAIFEVSISIRNPRRNEDSGYHTTFDLFIVLQKFNIPRNIITIYQTYIGLSNAPDAFKVAYFNEIANVREEWKRYTGWVESDREDGNAFLDSIPDYIKIEFVDLIIVKLKDNIYDIFLDDTFITTNDPEYEGNENSYSYLYPFNAYNRISRLLTNCLLFGHENIVDDFHNRFSKEFNSDIDLDSFKYALNSMSAEFNYTAGENEKRIFEIDILNSDKRLSSKLFNEIERNDANHNEDVIDKFVQETNGIVDISYGYLYYSKGFNKPLVNVHNEDILKLSDINTSYNINSYELSYLADRLIKKVKLYSLEKNNIDYSFFKDITNKISKMRINSLEIPTLSEKVKKELSVISEDDELFNLFVKKDVVKDKFYTYFDFASNNDYKGFDINDTVSLFLENKELLNNNSEEFLQKFLKMLSSYYYNNTINSSSQFLSSCIQRVTDDLKSENSNENKILQFLYFSNFELGNKVSDFDSKNEITKRFIKKAISKRINASDNLRNSDLGFIFDINSVDMDKLSDFDIEKIKSEAGVGVDTEAEGSEIISEKNQIDERAHASGVLDYFESLFDTNIEYKKIKNAIFNNNTSINNNYEFYYIPISSINTNEKEVNLHSSFSKHTNDHITFLSTVKECGFLFDCYTLSFPYTSFFKRNIPFKIPSDFLNEVKNQSFNNETLVKNYCTFNTNINSKTASAYINFCIKNERKELTTISRKKIIDNFDEITNIENSSFKKIINDINIILSATTNIDDLNFEDINDIDKFIDDNKFIVGLSSSVISIYSEVYNNMFKENQLDLFWNNLNRFKQQGSSNEINTNSSTEKYLTIEIDNVIGANINEFSDFDFSQIKTGFTYSNNSLNIDQFKLNNTYNNSFVGYKDILSKNLIKLTSSDFNQSISFDMLSGYLNKKIKFEKNKDLEDKIINEDLKNFYNISNLDNKITSRFFNLFYLNTLSKELSRKFYYNKDFYSNFIVNQSESEDIKAHYEANINNLFNIYKEKEKFLNDNLMNTDNFNLKTKNILTFGITNKFIKSLSPRSIIKIDITNGENSSKTFYFSPLLTSVYPFFNDSIFLDTHVGLYDIYSNINKRYLIANKDDVFKLSVNDTHLNSSGYLNSFFGSNMSDDNRFILNRALDNIIVSNKLNNLLNLVFNFNIDVEDFYKKLQFNNNTTSIDLLNIINTISAFNFKKFSNVSKRYFNNNSIIDNENNIVILPGFEEMINNRTSIFETLININKMYSIEEINNSFREKVFYDFYHIPIYSGYDKYENIKITVDTVEL